MAEPDDKYWVYLTPTAAGMFHDGLWNDLMKEDPDDNPYLACSTIGVTDYGMLTLGILFNNQGKTGIIDVMIPPSYVAFIIGGEVRLKVGFGAK